MEVFQMNPTIYKAKLSFEESGVIQKSFTIVEKPRGTKVKTTYEVTVVFNVEKPDKCVLTFDPINTKISIDGTGENITLEGVKVDKKEEEIETKKARKRG